MEVIMLMSERSNMDPDPLDPRLPLAVLLVGGENELGPLSLQLFGGTYGSDFRQILFVSVGVMDYAVLDAGVDPSRGFEGTEEAGRLREKTRRRLDSYLAAARQLGMKADAQISIATNAVDEIDAVADGIIKRYPKAVFFISKMVFRKKRWFHRFLHGRTSDALRARLEGKGARVKMLPLVLSN
jgi:hypothetical protein